MRFLFLVCLVLSMSVSASAEVTLTFSQCQLSPGYDNLLNHLKKFKKQYIKQCEKKTSNKERCKDEYAETVKKHEDEKQSHLKTFVSAQGNLFSHKLNFRYDSSNALSSWEVNAPETWFDGKTKVVYPRKPSGHYSQSPGKYYLTPGSGWYSGESVESINKPLEDYPDLYFYNPKFITPGLSPSHKVYWLNRPNDDGYYISEDLPANLEINILHHAETKVRTAILRYFTGRNSYNYEYFWAQCKIETQTPDGKPPVDVW